MHLFTAATMCAVLSVSLAPQSAQAVDVFTALRNANAGNFADRIQSNPALASLIISSSVTTVFAPIDNATSSTAARRLGRRSVFTDEYSLCRSQSEAHNNRTTPKSKRSLTFPITNFITASSDVPANLGGQNQAVVAANGANSTNTTASPPIVIYSGLGHNVSVVQQFIPYDGGYIHTIDSSLTIPVKLSDTTNQTTQTTSFASLVGSMNLTSSLDTLPATTFFVPNNVAWESRNNSTSISPTTINGHAVPNFLGYLPSLTDGQVLTTKTGGKLKVTVNNGQVFINDALIVASNLVLENGVAHVIDKVLTPSLALVSGTSSTMWVNHFAVVAGAIVALLIPAVL